MSKSAAHQAPLGFAHDFVRDDEHVIVLEAITAGLNCIANQLMQIVARLNLRDSVDTDNPQLSR